MQDLPFWGQQLIYILIIVVAMVFGSHLYHKRHDAPQGGESARSARKKRPHKKR